MKKPYPLTCHINGRTWKISKVHGLTQDGENVWGVSDDLTREIKIRKGQVSIDEVDTLFHELLHAVCRSTADILSSEEEERNIRLFMGGLIPVLAYNKKLRAHLWALLEKAGKEKC